MAVFRAFIASAGITFDRNPLMWFTEVVLSMWIYLLSYQAPVAQVPAAFEKYLENLEGVRIFDNLWVVHGNLTAHALVASARAFLGDDSKIFVAEAHEDYAVHGVQGHLYRRR